MRRVPLGVGLCVLAAGVIGFAALIFYVTKIRPQPERLFVEQREKLGQKLYGKITAYDLEEEYPESPADVMEMYGEVLTLIYGNIIQDEGVLRKCVEVQRKFWTDDMKKAAAEEDQLARLKEDLTRIYGANVRLTRFDVKTYYFDPFDEELAIVATKETWLTLEETHHNFYLRLTGADEAGQGGKWLIQSLETVR
jgi:hypothetical protein